MKTPEEIKKGLECCTIKIGNMFADCPRCPYYQPGKFTRACDIPLHDDALALIQQLEAEKAELLRLLKEAAACGGVCVGCKHANESGDVLKKCEDLDFDCERCTEKCACHSCENNSNYEWQG